MNPTKRVGDWLRTRGGLLGGTALAILFLVVFLPTINGRISSWINGDSFREMLDRETSKGLKLDGKYAPLQRVGLWGLQGDSFIGEKGTHTIVAIQADGISGTFNPLGVVLRRWEIDNIHLKWGSVSLQKTDPAGTNEKPPGLPWWLFFWPDHVYLGDVKVDDAQILGQIRGQEAGIYHTFLEITPNGRDFEYDGRGGELRTALTPTLELRHAHLLIRKPRLYCAEFVLGDDAVHPDWGLSIKGDAGLQADRSVNLKIDLNSLNVAPWLPEKMRAHVVGLASAHFNYKSSGTGLETSEGGGTMTLTGGVLHELPLVHHYAVLTGSPDPGDLPLKVCQADLSWKNGSITVQNLKLESDGVFRIEGSLTLAHDQTLTGQLDLGLTDPYLRWLPTARQDIFTRDDGAYHFTTINLSGTAQKPQQDLSARLTTEVEKSPGLTLKLLLNQMGDWFDFSDAKGK